MRAGRVLGSVASRLSQVRRLGKRPCSVTRARSACISQVCCSRIASSPLTVETLRTTMMTSAFKKVRLRFYTSEFAEWEAKYMPQDETVSAT